MATTTATARAHILILTRCANGHPGDILAVYANHGDTPMDTFRRVLDAHDDGDMLPDFITARGY